MSRFVNAFMPKHQSITEACTALLVNTVALTVDSEAGLSAGEPHTLTSVMCCVSWSIPACRLLPPAKTEAAQVQLLFIRWYSMARETKHLTGALLGAGRSVWVSFAPLVAGHGVLLTLRQQFRSLVSTITLRHWTLSCSSQQGAGWKFLEAYSQQTG